MIFHCRSTRFIFCLSILLIFFLSLVIDVTPVSAAAIVVTTTDDEDLDNAECSLREAIKAANTDLAYNGCSAGSGADTIMLSADTYTLTSGNELPSISTDITIFGQGPATFNGERSTATIIEADECNPVEETCTHTHAIFDITIDGDLNLGDLTLRHGRVTIATTGGAIDNDGGLYLGHCVITANEAIKGGAIQSTFNGDVTIHYSTFAGNKGSSLNLGGAIYSAGHLSITNSTFSENEAGSGGAIHNADTLTITNSTFSENSAGSSHGGGLDNYGTATITNSTFSDNTGGNGAGIFNFTGSTLNFTNTIIANSVTGGDCYDLGTIGTNIKNLIEDGSCSPFLSGDPKLGALADNDASTQTHALLEGSPAIDAGDSAACPRADQRGVPRPQGDGCDIGAFEFFSAHANMSASPLSGAAPLDVFFTNESRGDYDTCLWDFGDSTTSNQCKDPQHTYNALGVYTVSLTVSGIGGEDTRTREEYIHVRSMIYLPLIR